MDWIALAGLPGTGKSTLARELARRLGAHVLDKDAVRAALFGAHVDHSREQDDLVVEALYAAAEQLTRQRSVNAVVLDGRTYSKRAQVDALRRAAARAGARLHVVECTARVETARARLERDAASGVHVARNRSFELYRALAAAADPIAGEQLVLATDDATPQELAERCVVWLSAKSP